MDLGVALEVWPGYAPVWSGYAPVWGLCGDLLEKCNFFAEITFLNIFSFRALKLLADSHVLGLFTPLFRRFTLSGVVHREELFEIYRFISKILHFMASGSVFICSIDFR